MYWSLLLASVTNLNPNTNPSTKPCLNPNVVTNTVRSLSTSPAQWRAPIRPGPCIVGTRFPTIRWRRTLWPSARRGSWWNSRTSAVMSEHPAWRRCRRKSSRPPAGKGRSAIRRCNHVDTNEITNQWRYIVWRKKMQWVKIVVVDQDNHRQVTPIP